MATAGSASDRRAAASLSNRCDSKVAHMIRTAKPALKLLPVVVALIALASAVVMIASDFNWRVVTAWVVVMALLLLRAWFSGVEQRIPQD